MRKKRLNEIFRWRSFMIRCFVACTLISLASTGVFAQQEKKVSISVKDVLIRTALEELQKKAGINFIYNEELVCPVTKISLEFKNAPLHRVLDELCKKISLRYELKKELVLLLPLEKKDVTVKKEFFTLTGRVADEKHQPIAGATIIVKGTTVGTATGVDGKYSLYLPKSLGVILQFSFVGMETKEVKYTGGDTLDVVLKEDVRQVDEVVVTGYQTLKKRSQAGSSSKVNASDLVLNGSQTLEQALQGKIPGMMVMSRSGLTGTRQRVRVRGTSTLLGNAEPVWVVDGVIQEDPLPFKSNDLTNLNPDNMDMIRDFVGGAISWLNPNDIDNVTVLKDAASTAIYGVKAANGVIVITTKKGQMGRMAVSYNGNFTFAPRMTYNKLELMNSQQRVEVSREAYNTGIPLSGSQDIGYMALAKAYKNREISLEEFSARAKQLERNNTDWFKILFRDAFSHNHNVSISGGSDKATYRASFGYLDDYNTAKGNEKKQYTGNMNVSVNLWESVTISTSLAGSVQKTKGFVGNDPYSYASTVNCAISAYDEDGERFFYADKTNGYLFNIKNELEHSGNKNTLSSLNAGFSLRWRILSDLVFNTSVSYSYSSANGEAYYGEETNYIAVKRGYNYEEYDVGSDEYKKSMLPHGGEFTESKNTSTTWSWRNQLEYNKVFNERHAVSLMAGQEAHGTERKESSLTAYGYMPNRGKVFVNLPPAEIISGIVTKINPYLRTIPELTEEVANFLSYYVTGSYMFDDRYAFNASVRADASNRFGQDKSARFQPVWSFGVRWNVGSERWLAGQDILSDMSLRASYGFQGNVVEGVSPELIATVSTSTTDYDYTLKLKDLPAPELKQERVSNVNLGVDLGLFKNKINGTFEWYRKKTKDMVVDVDVPYETGVLSRKMNGGCMSNSGWDASVSFVPVRTKDWVVSVSLNTGKTYNKVKSTIEPSGNWKDATTGNLNKDGYAVSSFWAFRFTGLSPEHGGPQFDFTGRELEEAKTDATVYMDYAGKMDPDFTGGLSFSVRYKTWSLSSALYLSLGNQSFLAPPAQVSTSIPSEYENMSKEWLKRWRKPGDEKHTNVPSLPNRVTSAEDIKYTLPDNSATLVYNPYECYAYSDIRVVDAWYLRCNNITLSYTVPAERLPRVFQNMNFQCSVSNPFQIRSKDFMGRDPEVALGSQPLQRGVSFSVRLSF